MDQGFQLNTHLHFSAIIHLSHFVDRTNFYLFTNGISHRNLISYSSNDPPTQISKALFKITPPIKFQQQQFLQSIVQQRYQNIKKPIETDEKKTKIFIDQFEFELKENISYVQQQYKFPIKYNQNFMLQHLYSCKYLTFLKDKQTNDYIFELSQIPTTNSLFNLLPCYNYQKDINTYIPFNSASFLNMKINQGLQIRNLYLNYKKQSVFNCWRIQQEQKAVVSVGLYQTAQEIDYKSICYGDTVWIFHLESGSFVKVKQQNNNSFDNYIMKKVRYIDGQYYEEDKEQNKIKTQILLQRTQNQTSAEKFGLWQIIYASEKGNTLNRKQHSDRFKGGRIKFDQEVRFFNLRYKQYLSVRKIKLGRNKFKFQLFTQKFQQQNTTFKIKSLSPNSLYCTTEDLFIIQHVLTETYLTLGEEFKITDQNALLEPSNDYKKEDNFKFTKIQFIQEWQNNYILSILPFLGQGVQVFKRITNQGFISKKQQVLLQLLLQNLIQLLSFSYDLTQGFQASQNKLGKMTYNHFMVQKLLKQQGVIQLLVNILQTINIDVIEYNRSQFKIIKQNSVNQSKKIINSEKQFKDSQKDSDIKKKQKLYDNQQLSIKGILKILKNFTPDLKGQIKKQPLNPTLLFNIINVSFKILRNCCKSNIENSLLLFKNLQTFIPYLSLGSYAQTFFIDSFVNNVILQQITSRQFRLIINQYIKIFKKRQQFSPEVFNLLINFIKIQNKAVSKNQVQIYKLFFEQFNPLIFPIEQIDERFYITYNRYKYELTDFSKKFPVETVTLASQIKIFGNLTFDRNYLCSKQIKKKFPLIVLILYLKMPSIHPLIKQGFIHLLNHTYLNQRPRFRNKQHFIYSFFNIKTKQKFNESLGIKHRRRKSQYMRDGYQYQLKQMSMRGISQQGQRQILSCIQDVDYISPGEIQQIKQWLKNQLKNYIQNAFTNNSNSNLSNKPSNPTNVLECELMLLSYMIELNIFTSKQSQYIESLLNSFIKKISSSLQLTNQTNVTLESTNFKTLLLEMVEKNIIRKYGTSAKFDGVQNQINQDNICSLYVNYAFYQNILLLEKSQKRKKQYDKVIQKILQLIQINNRIVIEDKLLNFLGDVIENQQYYLTKQSKIKFIQNVMIQKILQESFQKKKNTFQLLILLFYNSNNYKINLKTISLFVKQIFTQNFFINSLNKLIFIVDEDEHKKYIKMMQLYKQVKLLIEINQIWLNDQYESANYKYNSIILYLIDKIKSIIALTVKGYKKDSHHHGSSYNIFDSVIGLENNINRQEQIMLSNLDLDEEIISFIQNNIHIIKKIQRTTQANLLVVTLFRTCFLFLYVYIHNCPVNKKKIKQIISENRQDISLFFNSLGSVDYGQSRLLVQYMKDNFQESTQFFFKNAQNLQKNNKYTWIHGQLIVVLLKYYDESINSNLKKFFMTIFDYTSFKNFLWLNKNATELNLDLRFLQQTSFQPIFYHIKVMDSLLYLAYNLPQSSNTIKSHIKKSLSEAYLYSLLQEDDYYTRQNSIKTIYKLKVIFKFKIMKIIQLVYLSDNNKLMDFSLIVKQLKKYYNMVNLWIQQSPARQQTEDFRKVIPLSEIKQDKQTLVDLRINDLYNSTYKNEFLLQKYLQMIQSFCRTILKNQQLSQIHSISQNLIHRVFYLNQILHRVYKQNRQIYYVLPNQHNFKITISDIQQEQYNRKRYFLSLILEIQYNQNVYNKIKQNQQKMIHLFVQGLNKIHLKPFLFLRKIGEFLEDAFEKLQQDFSNVYQNLQMLVKLLTIWIRSLQLSQAQQLRVQMGKSQLIFPILNYFEVCHFDADNKRLFLVCLQFLTQMIGEQGNKFIQTIFNNYFTNKSDSINFFMKIKSILKQLNFQDNASYKCKKLIDGMQVYKRQVKSQKPEQFLVLNFLIALCKGNFRENQIFLSSLSNTSNFKIMGGIWQLLKMQQQKYPHHLINNKNYRLITQCFATIRQLVQGPCVQNQNEFLKRQFFITVMQYFEYQIEQQQLILEESLEGKIQQIGRISPTWSSQLRSFLNEQKITKHWMPSQVKYLCISLISSLISQNINENSINQLMVIDPNLIIRQIDKVYQRYLDLNLQYIRDNLQYSEDKQVILPLGFKLYEILQYFPKQKLPEQTQGVRFFKQHSRVIEVTHNDLCIVYFPKPILQISQAFRGEFLQSVDRTSINSKLRDLQNVQIQNRQSDFPYGWVFFFVVIVIVILDFIMLGEILLQFVKDFSIYPIFAGYIQFIQITTIKAVLLIFAIIMSLTFFALQIKGAVYMKQSTYAILDAQSLSEWEKAKGIFKLYYDNLSYSYYFVAFILLLLSLFNPFFDIVLLVAQMFKRNQTFSIIIRAVTQTLDQLCITLLVLVIATYILTSIIYYYYGYKSAYQNCSTLYYCFMISLDKGFKQDAGMVSDATDISFGNVLLNFIYLFIIKLIISQIIGAIIVDKFAEMREEKQALEEDQQSVCFICGIDRNTLDREEHGFDKHKQEYHNVFYYMEFLIHLEETKKSNLSGIQRFVFQQKRKGKLTWFPINRSFHLQNKKKLEEENMIAKQEVNSTQIQNQKLMKKIDSEINQINFNLNTMNEIVNMNLIREKKRN